MGYLSKALKTFTVGSFFLFCQPDWRPPGPEDVQQHRLGAGGTRRRQHQVVSFMSGQGCGSGSAWNQEGKDWKMQFSRVFLFLDTLICLFFFFNSKKQLEPDPKKINAYPPPCFTYVEQFVFTNFFLQRAWRKRQVIRIRIRTYTHWWETPRIWIRGGECGLCCPTTV